MSHPDMEVKLNGYVDGTLAAGDRAEVEAHLVECTECRAVVAELRDLQSAARSLPQSIEPKRDLWTGIETRLTRRGWRRFALAAAAIVILAFALYRLLPPSPTFYRPAEEGWVAVQADLDRSTDQLARILATERDRLNPETIALLERNLRIIDAAIAESRAALARDTANVDLQRLLAAAAHQKVELLQWAAHVAES